MFASAALNPPQQPISSRNHGQRLLTLIRLLENNAHDYASLEELVEIMQLIIASTSRRGVLEGNTELANQILGSGSLVQTLHGKKAKKSKSTNNNINELSLYSGDPEQADHALAEKMDVQLILSAVSRILTAQQPDENFALLVILACDLIVAAATTTGTSNQQSICEQAAYELVASVGKPLLKGLEQTAAKLLIRMQKATIDDDNCETITALSSCYSAAASLVCLFGVKLSRSTALLADLSTMGCQGLLSSGNNITNHQMQSSAALLLACLPLCGDGGTPVAQVWESTLGDCLMALTKTIGTVAPINKKFVYSLFENQQQPTSAVLGAALNDVLEKIRTADSETTKVDFTVFTIRGFCQVLVLLLQRPSPAYKSVLLNGQLDIIQYLCVIEYMIAFSPSSEVVLFNVKKRLRQEAVEDGLLSPLSIAEKVANVIKSSGLDLLGVLIQSVGGPPLFPFANRIAMIAHLALSTSASTVLHIALDPSSAVQLSGKKRKRWLHSSLALRSQSVRAFELTIAAFGISMSSGSSSKKSLISQEEVKGISIVAGSIVELLQAEENAADWGTESERNDLAIACASCLTTCMGSSGEFLAVPTRSLIESVALLCLDSVPNGNSSSTAKAAFLLLGTMCVTTPWCDGAASSICEKLLLVAQQAQCDGDIAVASAAAGAIRACMSSLTPRVPALQVITRSTKTREAGQSRFVSVQAITDRIEEAKGEAARLRQHEDVAIADGVGPKRSKISPLDVNSGRKELPPKVQAASKEDNVPAETAIREEVSCNLQEKERTGTVSSEAAVTRVQIKVDDIPLEKKEPLLEESADEDDDFPIIHDTGPDKGDTDSD
jgi:hypothetical protein